MDAVYEDENIILINKEKGACSPFGDKGTKDTLLERMVIPGKKANTVLKRTQFASHSATA